MGVSIQAAATGPDYFTRLRPDNAKAKAVHQLNSLGYDVTITPRQEAVAG
ncbi:MAG: hypothetical protein FWF02_12670 [Micrococcales bacterium]|nr:hypothetical protein [Micrococcales bacterium]MCL2668528.1 hypothetical protein [Micrococcales bacterium]